jgi:tetratricopeptide (TPR) repeat protein
VIGRAREWYRSPEVAQALLEKSRQAMPEEPSEAEHLASLARAVASRSPAAGFAGLECLAAMHEANALRVKGRLREAEHLARHARFLASDAEVRDLQVLAELDWYEGALRKDQDRLDESEALLVRAVAQYRLARKSVPMASCLITLGELYRTAGEPEKAVEVAREVLETINPVSQARLYLCARHNLALYLSDVGRNEEAAAALEDARSLYEAFPDKWTKLRLRWLEGRINRGLGRHAEAREAFAEVAIAYLSLGVGYDAALATIDAAEVCLLEGKRTEFAALAKLLEPVLRAEDLHQEARQAIALFQKALASRMVTEALTAHVRTYLTEARSNPSLRYEPA